MASAITDVGRAKRLEIIEGAAALFAERGYHATSMADIAAAARVGKSTLYHYFSGKDVILFELHDELMESLLEPHRARIAGGERDPLVLLRAAMHDLVRYVAARRGHVRVFLEEFAGLSDRYRPRVAGKRDEYAAAMTGLLVEAQRTGRVRALDPTVARLAVFGMCTWAYQWFDPSGPLSPDDVAEIMWDVVSRGLLVPGSDQGVQG